MKAAFIHAMVLALVFLASKGYAEDLQVCRDSIAAKICWAAPAPEGMPRKDRPCIAGGEKFAGLFEGHFDRSPAFIKKMYCHIGKIWVEKSFHGTAYADGVVDANGKLVSSEIGIREEVSLNPMNFDDWLSWKEETSFGGNTSTGAARMGLIAYKSNQSTPEFFIDYLLNHEFGHLFDFANKLNATTPCEIKEDPAGNISGQENCIPLPNTWGAISWENDLKPKADETYDYRNDICFYSCKGKFVSVDKAGEIFASLMGSGFQSTYAGMHPMEDFADTFAMYLAHNLFGLRYEITIQGQTFDMTAHFNSPKLERKREFIRRFLEGSFIYPGDGVAASQKGTYLVPLDYQAK